MWKTCQNFFSLIHCSALETVPIPRNAPSHQTEKRPSSRWPSFLRLTYGGFYDGKNYVKSEKWAWTVEPDGRYSDIPVVVLVNAGTASSGDMLAYRLSNCPNVTMMGVTTTWGSAQSLGGMCLLSGGKIQVRYPIIATLGGNNEILVDAGKDRVSNIRIDEKIPLDDKAVKIYYEIDGDYDLAYARIYLNKKLEE